MADNGDGLAAFVAGLPEGQRHKGFYWAVKTATEDDLPTAEVAKVAKAGIDAGLDEGYVKRTIAEALAEEIKLRFSLATTVVLVAHTSGCSSRCSSSRSTATT